MKNDPVLYKCLHCGKEVHITLSVAKKIICSYCGYRTLEKYRPEVPKRVLAR